MESETVRDLVERLRKAPLYYGYGEATDLPEQAADAIERLTRERDGALDANGGILNAYKCVMAERDAIRAEVEELRSRRIVYSPDAKALYDRCTAAEAECERLRAENERLKEAKDNLHWNLRTERDATKAAEGALATAREAMRPFATLEHPFSCDGNTDDYDWFSWGGEQLTVGHFRAIRAALAALPPAPETK